ncbi:MAG: hypothetical protein EHM36_16300, partial [Deltaproteobacteria bacterium]
MNRMRDVFFGIVGILTVIGTILLGNPEIVGAQEKCFPIHIRSKAGIEPDLLNVNRGDCVVWINWTRGEDAQIIFRDGKKCADMTKSPVKFKPDFSGCYLTDFLSFGETASLVFVEAGKFDYEVEFRTPGGLYGAG